jgi:hypothetical protein
MDGGLLQISRCTHFEAFETEAEVRSTQWLSLGGDRDQMYQIIKREACHPTRHGLPRTLNGARLGYAGPSGEKADQGGPATLPSTISSTKFSRRTLPATLVGGNPLVCF